MHKLCIMLAIINDSCWCSKLKSKWAASRLWRVFWCVADLFWDALKTASSDWGPIVDKLQNTWYGWQCQLDTLQASVCQWHAGAVSITSNCFNFEMIDAGAKSLLCVARHSIVYNAWSIWSKVDWVQKQKCSFFFQCWLTNLFTWSKV